MDKDIAIQVNNVSKTFKIPHEKVTSIRGAVVSGLSKLSFKGSQSSAFGAKTYEEFKALDDVSFEVKRGEFFGIIGRNGSGKSTLLKILAGIYQPDKGKVKINGRISPFLELGIGFNPELSGRDNVYLNATVLGLTKKEIDEKFDSIVKFSELERFIDQKLKNYSSGMQVRLAFSVSIHANRDILLMDEVLAVGDSNFQSKCLSEFNKYKEAGKTVILVTHDIAIVQRYCDRAMLVRNGKIMKIGSAEEVGNEYVYQNMSDEERRMHAEQKAKKDNAGENNLKEGKIKKIAEITKVEFLDKDGNLKKVFETGDELMLKVIFNYNKINSDINFGVSMHSEDNFYIFGINTFNDIIDIDECLRRGYFQIKYKNLPLKTGRYYFRVVIFGGNPKIHIDYIGRTQSFVVGSKNNNSGIIELNYNWK